MTATKIKVAEAHIAKVSRNGRDKSIPSKNDASAGEDIDVQGQPAKKQAGTCLEYGLEDSGSGEADEPDDKSKRLQYTLCFV